MWQFANEVAPCTGSTLSGGRGNRDRPRERFTIFSVLPAMDRKQKQAEKVQYAHTAMINTLHFSPAPLFFHASVIPSSLIFNIPFPNLNLIVLARSYKEHRAFSLGAQHHAEALSPCRFTLSSSLCLTAGRRWRDSYFLIALEIKGYVLTGFASSVR